MTFQELQHFLLHEMRMSHIYQPLMLKQLIKSGGISSREDIAKAILQYDPSQVEYYEQIVDKMVGKVLRGRSIVTRDRKTKDYRLTISQELTQSEQKELVGLCERKLEDFLASRKMDPYGHRRVSKGYVKGTTRYEVFERVSCAVSYVVSQQR